MKEKEIKALMRKLQLSAYSSSKKCLYCNCTSTSISSHLIQKNGLLSNIAENQHLIKVSVHPFEQQFFKFNKVGINTNALTFSGFCSSHDDSLFKEIEKEDVDYTKYMSMVLLSYKALMNEKRKKENVVEWFNKILNSNILKKYLDKDHLNHIESNRKQQLLGIKDSKYYEDLFIGNIENIDKKDFSFVTYQLPKLPICASGCFPYETTQEMAFMHFINPAKMEETPLSDIYFHLLPLKDYTLVIIGCSNNVNSKCWKFIESFSENTITERLKKISNLLLLQIENWLCEPTYFETFLKPKQDEIIKIIRNSVYNSNERNTDLKFNLFE